MTFFLFKYLIVFLLCPILENILFESHLMKGSQEVVLQNFETHVDGRNFLFIFLYFGGPSSVLCDGEYDHTVGDHVGQEVDHHHGLP